MESIDSVKVLNNKPLTFSVQFNKKVDRLDCVWFNPEINKKIKEIKSSSKDKGNVSLKEISKVSGGKRLPKNTVLIDDENHYIPYIRGVDVKNMKIKLESAKRITGNIHKLIQNYQLKKEDIVVSIVGTIGNVGILDKEVEVCDFTENIARIRTFNEKINNRYLLYYLDSELAKIQFEKFSVGSLQYKLSLNNLRNNIKIIIPLNKKEFSSSEQNKILKKIDESFLESEKLKKESEEIIEKVNKLLFKKFKIKIPISKKTDIFNTKIGGDSERLDALFNNPKRESLRKNIRNFKDWDFLENIIEFEEDKKFIPSEFYNLVDLSDIDEKVGKIVSSKEVSDLGSSKILLKKNTILISKLQPEQGKIVIVDEDSEGFVASSELIPIRIKKENISLEYLWIILRSPYVLKQWEYSLTGSSRMRIGKTEIKKTIIPIPKKELMEEIVKEVFSLLKKAKEIKEKGEIIKQTAKEDFVKILMN